MVDWAIAAQTGALLVRGGPQVPREEAETAVTDLRELTVEAEGHVRQLTNLGLDLPLLPGEVVDRPGWVRSAAAGLDALTGRALPQQGGPLGPILAGGAGVQTGLVLAFLASRVLGQYDPFGGPDREGRLLLVAPSVDTIRERFTARRKGGGVFDRLLRALLGVDAKIRQYEEGAKFTRHVVDAVGMEGFNAVWRSPNTLPSRAEISDPAAWVRRLHG